VSSKNRRPRRVRRPAGSQAPLPLARSGDAGNHPHQANARPLKPLKIPALHNQEETARLQEGIRKARCMVESLQKGDREALTEATILQGILSGDVVAASIAQRQRLQAEVLRLRARIVRARLKTEEAKRRYLESEITHRDRQVAIGEETFRRIREIYGIEPRQLPAPTIEVTKP
jgi:hypothetical protein